MEGASLIYSTIDKLFFGLTLLFALQVPQLADQYHQFIAGAYDANQWQIDGYQTTADKYGYPSIDDMIEHHLKNDVESVRDDAIQKQSTLQRQNDLGKGLQVFAEGNLIEKIGFMLSPSGWPYLDKTLKQFTFGLPISTEGILFGVILGLLLNLIISAPTQIVVRKRRARKKAAKEENIPKKQPL